VLSEPVRRQLGRVGHAALTAAVLVFLAALALTWSATAGRAMVIAAACAAVWRFFQRRHDA
jgi:hypothetical protein